MNESNVLKGFCDFIQDANDIYFDYMQDIIEV